MHKVQIAATGVRNLDHIHEPDLTRIQDGIFALEFDPRPRGATKLKDLLYRIRVGAWRILYHVDDRLKVVTILQVLRRSERTYKGL